MKARFYLPILGLMCSFGYVQAEYGMEEIMKKGHKGKTSLLAKVVNGKASKDEINKMAEYYKEMAKFKPEKGSAESWKKKNDLLLKLIGEVQSGKKESAMALKKAANCKACHKIHKPKK